MPYCELNSTQLHYRTFGAARPDRPLLLLIHGATSTGAAEWGHIAPSLACEYHVIVPDCRGHGRSPNPQHTYRFAEMADDLAALIRALGHPRAHVIGHSNGGNVALTLLLEHPDVVQCAVLQAANAYVSDDLRAREPAVFDLELVEQPLPVGDIEGLRWLKAQGFGLPIFADESIKTARDVAAHAGAVDGVVIKLMKTSGIREALRAIHTAHALGMQVMLSCMVESSVGVTAAAHLASLCELTDLDGPLLVRNDPFTGVTYDGARLCLPDLPGIGVV